MKSEIQQSLLTPISDYLPRFEEFYKNSLKSNVKIINTVITYISRRKGKQLRPSLCLLAAKLCGEPSENTYKAAALIEMIHVATLIHDDVVDDAHLRRGFPSVNCVWKNKLSILVGDYMFSKALTNMIQIKDFNSLKILSSTAERLSQGEILQIEKVMTKKMTEEIYYKMVSDKTASLFSASCELGCITVIEDDEKRRALSGFGEKFGLVFQIRDDLLDIIGNVEALGKPAAFDLKRNIQTLPLIHIFNKLSKAEAMILKLKLRYHLKRSEMNAIRQLISDEGGIEFAERQIQRLTNEARDDLNIFPDSIYKDTLLAVLSFNSERMK